MGKSFTHILLKIIVYLFIPPISLFFHFLLWKRRSFEAKNSLPRLSNVLATFEISSEGELEQILPLLFELLKTGENIQLFFCSPSVEGKCLDLEKQYPNLEVFRLPLFSWKVFSKNEFFPNMVKGKFLIMNRYDFFPSLLLAVTSSKIQSILINGTIVGKENKIVSLNLRKIIYSLFDQLYLTTQADYNFFQSLKNVKGYFDLRFIRIQNRLDNLKSTTNSLFLTGKKIKEFTNGESLIIGSFYLDELMNIKVVFEGSQQVVFLFPHKLDPSNIQSIGNHFRDLQKNDSNIFFLEINDENGLKDFYQELVNNHFRDKKIFLLMNIKGVLCEFYSFSDLAIVGGGWRGNTHSVLEAYMGSKRVFCGPGTLKSTEFKELKALDPKNIISKANLNSKEITVSSAVKNEYHINSRINEYKSSLKELVEFIQKF